MKKVYLYLHINPKTEVVFYVGVGSISRTRNFKTRSAAYLEYVKANDFTPVSKIVGTFEDDYEANKQESELIKKFGMIKDGGQLVNQQSHSKVWTEELRLRVGSLRKGEFAGELNPYYGKHHSDEVRAKMSELRKGIPTSENQKRVTSERMRGGKHPRAKMVIDTVSGVIYPCAKDASAVVGLAHSTMRGMLNGGKRNKTTLRYL